MNKGRAADWMMFQDKRARLLVRGLKVIRSDIQTAQVSPETAPSDRAAHLLFSRVTGALCWLQWCSPCSVLEQDVS